MTTKLSKLQDSIKLLGKLAAKRNLELYIVGGMVREIVYLEVLKGADIISDSFKQRNLLEDIFEVDIKNEINFDLDLVINCDAINFIEEIQDEFFQEFKAKIIIKDISINIRLSIRDIV